MMSRTPHRGLALDTLPEGNCFLSGPIAQGASRGMVSDGVITVQLLGWGEEDKPFLFALAQPVSVKAGDVISLKNTNAMSGNPNDAFINGYLNKNVSIMSNKLIRVWLNGSFCFTAAEDFLLTGISVCPVNGSMGSFSWKSELRVNGEVIVP